MADPKKILVVDDNAAFTELVGFVFGEFSVIRACDGQEGLKLAREFRPDVILLDVVMPKISGVEMLRQLQSDEQIRTIPVVVLTATPLDSSTQARFKREPNVRAFLRKPCSVDALRAEIGAALDGGGNSGGKRHA